MMMIARGDNITFRTSVAALLRAGLDAGLAVLAAGCQRMYRYEEGKTFDECKADLGDCQTELFKRTDRRYARNYKHRLLEDCMRRRAAFSDQPRPSPRPGLPSSSR